MNVLRLSRALPLLALAVACSGYPPPCSDGTVNACGCACDGVGTGGSDGDDSGGTGSGSTGSGSASSGGDGGGAGDSGGTAGASTTGGSAGEGGWGGDASSGGANPEDCDHVTVACAYTAAEFPDEATQKDEDSGRSESGYFCSVGTETTWVREEQCPFTEQCRPAGDGDTACQPCGDDARKTAQRRIDGTLTEDCEGCRCPFWSVLSCTTSTTEHGEPFVTLQFDSGPDPAFVFDLGQSGQTWTVFQDAVVEVSNVDVTIEPGGQIELDVLVEATVERTSGVEEVWEIEGHVVGECAE